MRVVAVSFAVLCLFQYKAQSEDTVVQSEIKTLTPEESSQVISAGIDGETVLADVSRGVPPDNGGNYGDLVYRYREQKDRLLLREVVISQQLSSSEQDIHWSVSISGARINSVRVLNFGRQRAYCLRIDVAGSDAQAVIRVPPLFDPRIMIEIYGY
ncbi:hypothetical protein NQ315_015904 [Exocentrus adspersus]|uniref:Uncharacterized protein n=1 Tax=Exocentrus adspersus TaxID=1586481 RepID=A0AAV8W3A0_9CUCU|nr:hypothetical protein NQ315_015904 [Exocentrus adspersus]